MIKRNILSILLAILILYVSLANPQTFDRVPLINIPFFDKIIHFLMYFVFMSVIIYENRLILKTTNQLLLTAIIPSVYGIVIEFLQAYLTVGRSGNFFDGLADVLGILLSIILWILLRPMNKTIK